MDTNTSTNTGVINLSGMVASAGTTVPVGIVLNPPTIGSTLNTAVVSAAPSATAPSTNTNIVSRTLSTVSKDFETAVTDVESFVNSKAGYIEAYIAGEFAILKANAEADYNKVLAEKQTIVTDLENEFTQAKTWLSNKWEQIKAIF